MAEGVGQTGSRGCPGLGRGSRPLGPGRERRTETQRHGEVAGQRYGLPPRPRSPLGRRSGYAADVGSPGCKNAGPALAESEAKRLSSRLSPSPEQAWAESSCSPLGPCKEKPQGAQKLGKLRPEHGKKEEKEGNLRSGEPNQMPWVKPSAQCPVLSKHPLNGDGDGGGG